VKTMIAVLIGLLYFTGTVASLAKLVVYFREK